MTLADGCFDPLHVGHVRYLQHAAQIGHPLVVHIASDEAIRAKGREPFQERSERAETIYALGVVDMVRMHDSLADAIRDLKPRCLVKGKDWIGRLPLEIRQACHEVGAEISYTDTQTETSTERLAR